MVRFSVSLDDEQNEWVEQRAAELNGSKTQVIGMLVDAARDGDLADSLPTSGTPDSETTDTESVREAIQRLESRVAELERDRQRSTAPAEGEEAEREKKHSVGHPPDDRSSSDERPDVDTGCRSGSEEMEAKTDHQNTAPTEGSSTGEANARTLRGGSKQEPDAAAIEAALGSTDTGPARTSEIVACWKLLKKRGTAGPRAFKRSCHDREDGDVEVWWDEGVRPVLVDLPGVDPPEGGGRFFRYRY